MVYLKIRRRAVLRFPLLVVMLVALAIGTKPAAGQAAPAAGEWGWMSGADTSWAYLGNTGTEGPPGVYGMEGEFASGNVPGRRGSSATWTDSSGNLWLFGGQGLDSVGHYGGLNDLWEFDPIREQWAWIAGSSTDIVIGGSGNNVQYGSPAVYGMQGSFAASNTPGARGGAASWTDKNGNFWLFGGGGQTDLWEFNVSLKQWAWIAGSNTSNFGVYGAQGAALAGNTPGERSLAAAWVDSTGNLWLFGGLGYGASVETVLPGVGYGYLDDLWEFSPITKFWTWMGGSQSTSGTPPVYGMQGSFAAGNDPGARSAAVSWTDPAGNFWLFGGYGEGNINVSGDQYYLNDLWEFNPTTQMWAWISGGQAPGVELPGGTGYPGVYGAMGVPAPANVPGSREYGTGWVDKSGNLWLFGGEGYDSAGDFEGYGLNDLWAFNPSSKEWTWMGGSNRGNESGIYGMLGVPAGGNSPGARISSVGWTDPTGNFWLFGGDGFDGEGFTDPGIAGDGLGYMNDLWEYQPQTGPQTVDQPVFSEPNGTYSPGQQVTITDGTSGASIYYTTNGTTPSATNGSLYSASTGLTLSSTVSIEAVGVLSGLNNSAVATASYTVAVAAGEPSFMPAPGTYGTGQLVTIASSPSSSIYYTTNGTTPSATNGTLYTGPVAVNQTETIEAIAGGTGYTSSAVATGTYTLVGTPSVLTGVATNIGSTGATLTMTVNDFNLPSYAGILLWTNTTDTVFLQGSILTSPDLQVITVTPTNLKSGTKYYYQAFAAYYNAASYSYGAHLSFTTQ